MDVTSRKSRVSHPSITPSPCQPYTLKFALDATSAQAAFVRTIFLKAIPTLRLDLVRYEMSESNILFDHLVYQFRATTLLQTAPFPLAFSLAVTNTSERNIVFDYTGSEIAPFVFAQSRLAVIRPGLSIKCDLEVTRSTGHVNANYNATSMVAIRELDYDQSRLSLEQDPRKHEFTVHSNGDRPPATLFAEFKTTALAHVAALAQAAAVAHPSGVCFQYGVRDHFYQTINSLCELILDAHPELTLAFVSERDDGLLQLVLSIRDTAEATAIRDKGIKTLSQIVTAWKA